MSFNRRINDKTLENILENISNLSDIDTSDDDDIYGGCLISPVVSFYRKNSEDLFERRLEEIFGKQTLHPVPNETTNNKELPTSSLVEILQGPSTSEQSTSASSTPHSTPTLILSTMPTRSVFVSPLSTPPLLSSHELTGPVNDQPTPARPTIRIYRIQRLDN